MPLDPRVLQQRIRSSEFQSLQPTEQVELFRSELAQQDEEIASMGVDDQYDVARQLIEHHSPGFMDKLATVAEVAGSIVPGLGGGLAAKRRFEETGEVGPFASAVAAPFGGVTTPGGAFAAGAAADVGTFGAATLAGLGLGGVAQRALGVGRAVTGGALDDALGLAAKVGALAAPQATREAAVKLGADAARKSFMSHGITDFTIGEMFGVTKAIERGLEGQDQELLHDFVVEPIGLTALGIGLLGIRNAMRRFGERRAEEALINFIGPNAERYADIMGQSGPVIEAVRRASGGKLSRDQAAEYVFDAVTGPLADRTDLKIVRDAIKANPEILQSELGQRMLMTQRDRLMSPETFIRRDAVGLKVHFDEPGGQSRVLDVPPGDTKISGEILERAKAGDIVITALEGNEREIARYGQRFGVGVSPIDQGGSTLSRKPGPIGFGRGVDVMGGPVETVAGNIPNNAEAMIARQVEAMQKMGMAGEKLRGVDGNADVIDDILKSADAGGVPAFVSKRLRTAAVGAGIDEATVANSTPGEIIEMLRTTRSAATGVEETAETVIGGLPVPYEKPVPELRTGPVGSFEPTVEELIVDGTMPKLLSVEFNPGPVVYLPNGYPVVMSVERHAQARVIPPKGSPVTVKGTNFTGEVVDSDPLGRITVKFPDGRLAKGPVSVDQQFNAQMDLDQIFIEGIGVKPWEVHAQPAKIRQVILTPSEDALIREGQTLLPNRPGAKPVKIADRQGDRVWLQQGESVIEKPIQTVYDALESGAARLAVRGKDLNAFVDFAAKTVNDADKAIRMNNLGATRIQMELTKIAGRMDEAAANVEELNTRFGQKPSRSRAKSPKATNDGIKTAKKKAKEVPENEKTEGGSLTTKGCKPKRRK